MVAGPSPAGPAKPSASTTIRHPSPPERSIPARYLSPSKSRSASASRTRPTNNPPSSLTTRSLSVSFQGESFVYQSTKSIDSTPPARKPSPKRVPSSTHNAVPSSAPVKHAAHYPWPSAKTHFSNPLTKSLDCSVTKRTPALASTINSLRRSMMFGDDVARRNSFDAGEILLSSDTDSTSSGSLETSIAPRTRGITRTSFNTLPSYPTNRVKRVAEPVNPLRKPSTNNASSPLNGSNRVTGRMVSPARGRNANFSNVRGVFAKTEGKRKKKGEGKIEEEHLLRILHSRHLQWWCVNAQAEEINISQKEIAEKYLYDAWIALSEKLDSVMLRRLKVHLLTHNLKLLTVFKGQMRYLEQFSLLDKEYYNSLNGLIDSLKSVTLSLPLTGDLKADTQEVKNAIGSAVDVMQTLSRSIYSLLYKVEETKILMSELASVTSQEKDLMHQSRELLSTLASLNVKYCSMEGQKLQLTNIRKIN
ncbi:hypothetical protein LUZ60_010169 [Juncus effusus]|nr:hypothetical protein LUZ60_010169 [Juncus effusus]